MNSKIKRFVLTGAPGSGKSSVLTFLELRGELVVPEASADYIRLQQAMGNPAPWEHDDFERKVVELQYARERKLENTHYVRAFFDRGLLDVLAYFQRLKRPIDTYCQDIIGSLSPSHYATVFLMRPLELYKQEEFRPEDLQSAIRLGEQQEQNYRSYGFNVVNVIEGDVPTRANFILNYAGGR